MLTKKILFGFAFITSDLKIHYFRVEEMNKKNTKALKCFNFLNV